MNILIKQCPSLRKIKLENNKIDDIKQIDNLLGLNIKKINVSGNPFIKDNKDYKEKLFNTFLSLISIDNTDIEGNDIESTEYENSQNLFEKVENVVNNEKKDNNVNKQDNESDIISYDSNFVDDENIDDDLCEEEEEEEDDDDDDDNDEDNEVDKIEKNNIKKEKKDNNSNC